MITIVILVEIFGMSVCWTCWVRCFSVCNEWPRVRPTILDQTDGDFSTITHQLNTRLPSGYIMGMHDVISTRDYCYWVVSLLLSSDAMLTWYDNMVWNILTILTWRWSCLLIEITLQHDVWSNQWQICKERWWAVPQVLHIWCLHGPLIAALQSEHRKHPSIT